MLTLGTAFSAISLMAAGLALSLLREAPKKVGNRLLDIFSCHITINVQDAVRWFGSWISESEYGIRCRTLKVSLRPRETGEGRVILVPGDGPHLFRFGGRWVYMHCSEDRNDAWSRRDMTVHIRTPGRDKAWLEGVVRTAIAYGRRIEEQRNLIRVNGSLGEWVTLDLCATRDIATVILPGREKEDVLTDIKNFFSCADIYARRGTPYRRGYLFSGPPGTGKTSLARALASELHLSLYVLDLSSDRTSDSDLFFLLSKVPPKSVVLVEDIDRTRPVQRQESAGNGVTMAGLLNAIDGPLAGEGRIMIFTTNHTEHLDPALLRPGRIDYRINFGPVRREQAQALFLRYFPNERLASSFAATLNGEEVMAAELEGLLLSANNNPELAISSLAERSRCAKP